MKKNIISVLLCLVMLLFPISYLTSCANENSGVTTLYVYNWGEYMSDGSEGSFPVNDKFEEWYYQNYGKRVKVNYSTYSSNEDLYAKISSGAVNYDVIFPSDYMVQRLIEDKRLAPLNYDNILNEENLLPQFFGENAEYDYYDEGNVYSVPYLYGMIGIIYNTTMVDAEDVEEQSWRLMWNEKYAGNILQFNNSRDAFGTAQYYLGFDVNTATEEEWRIALGKLQEQKKIVQGYVMDEIFNKMENGSAAIAAYYAGDYLTMYENNPELEFYYPKEGTNLYVDAMCIPTTSKNKEIAERYIGFLLSEEAAIANAEYTYYASPNRLVVENEEYRTYMSEIKDDAYEKMYDTSIKATPYKNLTEDKLVVLNGLWEELKADIDIGISIYIICGAIIIVLITMLISYLIKKRIKKKIYDNV